MHSERRIKGVLFMIAAIILIISCKNETNPQVEIEEKSTDVNIEVPNDASQTKKKILFFGNSLTAGLGLDESQSFPALIQERLDSLGYDYTAINAGLSGETTAGGKGRIDWVLREPVDVFVLELGANDMLRGLDLNSTRENLQAILEVVQEKSPDAKVVIAGMEAPPNMGASYTNQFREIFAELAEKYNASLLPFLLDGVAGRADLNLGDGKHPNVKGQKVVMENVWEVLYPILEK